MGDLFPKSFGMQGVPFHGVGIKWTDLSRRCARARAHLEAHLPSGEVVLTAVRAVPITIDIDISAPYRIASAIGAAPIV
eukprot:8497808-Pyramimonas_sp.AAC.1